MASASFPFISHTKALKTSSKHHLNRPKSCIIKCTSNPMAQNTNPPSPNSKPQAAAAAAASDPQQSDSFPITERRRKSEIIRDRKAEKSIIKPEPPNLEIGWKRTKEIKLEKPKGYIIMDFLEKLETLMGMQYGSKELLAKTGEIVAERAREEAEVLKEGGEVEERLVTELFRVLRLMEMDLAMVKAAVKEETLNERIEQAKARCSFGDSLADTGNFAYYDPHSRCKHFPYGITFFNQSTGRCSNGRLIIDFIAQALGLPFLPSYLGHNKQDFKQGVNFAVIGATALDSASLLKRGIRVETNYSLEVQLGWFKQLLPSLCSTPSNCGKMLRNALFTVGEIGGNDYNDPLLEGKNTQELQTLVPEVINIISSAITALIDEGAVTLLVPGNFPIGCLSSYLTIFESPNQNDYDPSGCIKSLNEFALFHNQHLQNELNRLREIYPHTTIIYADYYNLAMDLFRFPKQLGFNGTSRTLASCCGGGGRYNYNASAKCGFKGSTCCDDPSLRVNWDGIHLTETAYKWIATGILERSFTSCISSKQHNVEHSISLLSSL